MREGYKCVPETVSPRGSPVTRPPGHTAASHGMYLMTDVCVKPGQTAAWGSLGRLQQV